MSGPYSNDQGNPAAAIPVYFGVAPSSAQPSVNLINTDATTLVKTGAGNLSSITIGTIGTGWSLAIYDGLTAGGTLLATITPTQPTTLPLNLPFSVGLTIVSAGSAAGSATVSYH